MFPPEEGSEGNRGSPLHCTRRHAGRIAESGKWLSRKSAARYNIASILRSITKLGHL